jgi:hypothetical protein
MFEFNISKVEQFWVIIIARMAKKRWRTKSLQMR